MAEPEHLKITKKLKPAVRVTFWGATRTVTGSKYLIEYDNTKLLVDAGLFQGKKELRLRNWEVPPFNPASLDAVVLTHAHIDHTGFLPLLVRQGFRGRVYCTEATAEFLKLLLPDSAHLQEEEAQFANRHGTSKHKPALPLYGYRDVERTLDLIHFIERDTPQKILPQCEVMASTAGHILGAVILSFDIHGKRITFSGDIGRFDAPILPDPKPVQLGELVLCESTYGDRLHEELDVKAELTRVIKDVVDRRGPLLIPAFAVGRTQMLLYYLAQLERSGDIPVLPVFVDSPMAIDATKIYRQFRHDYDDEAIQLLDEGETPLLTQNVSFSRSVKESKLLNYQQGPRIIISASGMVTGGRILHHVKNWLPNPATTMLFVGYQATGTRGQTILSGAETVKVFGENVPIRAKIESLSGLSAHGDRSELLRWLESCSGAPKRVAIVHGEDGVCEAFADTITSHFGWNARPADYGESVEL